MLKNSKNNLRGVAEERRKEKMMGFFSALKFRMAFGFFPSRVSGMKKHEQARVDDVLASHAVSYQWACRAQDKAQQSGVSTMKLPDKAQELKKCERAVEEAKRNFWYVWRLAKDQGYYVLPKHLDYLPREPRWK